MNVHVPPSPAPHTLARRVLAAIDLTSLGEGDDRQQIDRLCAAADTPYGPPAALCVYPEWIVVARDGLLRRGLHTVRVATVVNFPDGAGDPARVERETQRALAAGADEIDLVLPYRALLAGDDASVAAVLASARSACTGKLLKVILETGQLGDSAMIRQASELALSAGADFLKTSTGKVAVNATLPAAQVMLQVIHEHGGHCGFKAAGGIRSVADAAAYFDLADRRFGADWASPRHFRIGASSLLRGVLDVLAGSPEPVHRDGY